MALKGLKKIRVAELFAGVGGFRLGLMSTKKYSVVWSNQWEPGTIKQHASDIYVARFGKAHHSNVDINKVKSADIPHHDLLVGGFPCQDYSIANPKHGDGIKGKKGVLWWQIYRIARDMGKDGAKYLMLENVDRLLASPKTQHGRDFAIMLASLSKLGFAVEWRVINASDYGMPQKRKRVYILAYRKGTGLYFETTGSDIQKWLLHDGVFASAFPVTSSFKVRSFKLSGNAGKLSKNFNVHNKKSLFENTGVMFDGKVFTLKTSAKYLGKRTVLGDVLVPPDHVPPQFYIPKNDLSKWAYLKGEKKVRKVGRGGFPYLFIEGAVSFPDRLDTPSKTIITSEGGSYPSRFTHVITTNDGRYRRLLPVELERLCMFPDNHTVGASDVRRAFFMGNALVVGVIKKLGSKLAKRVA